MYSENSLVLMSDDLQSTKSGVKTGYVGINGHISQIPGLSPAICTPPGERARGRRAGVLESDTDYVKLAKQGGHKGLLWHEEAITSKACPYQPPDWFCPASADNSKPGLINSDEKKHPGAFQQLEPPFGTDNMSAWERDDSNSNSKEKNGDTLSNLMEKSQSPSQYYQTSKFKRIVNSTESPETSVTEVFDKRPAPVDMSKLLSFGYAEEDKPIANADLSN